MSQAPLLLLQLAVILATARALAFLVGRFGQPAVIGEMIAGLALGPMAFGALAPQAQAWLFPPARLATLEGLSQVGLVLFMFIVGAELRAPGGTRRQFVAAAWVALPGVLLPMAFGIALAPLLHARLAPAGIGIVPFALFIGVSMAVTAFPVMARILKDRGLTRSAAGQLSLAGAALSDVLAWILLALLTALVSGHGRWSDLLRACAGLALLTLIGLGLLRPAFARLLARAEGQPRGEVLSLLLIGTCAMAAATEWLGLHAVFGAFLFGACLPRDDCLLRTLIERVEHVAVLVLLPVFFALAGLDTRADALGGGGFAMLLFILAGAVAGKMLGAGGGARMAGLGWRDAFAVGALMNTRGLMELIVLKVGLDAGVIGPSVFTLLLLMAIATTLMTAPLLGACLRREATQGGTSHGIEPMEDSCK